MKHLLALCALLMLAACGQKGALYFAPPEQTPPAAQTEATNEAEAEAEAEQNSADIQTEQPE